MSPHLTISSDFEPSFNNAFSFDFSYPSSECRGARVGTLKTPHGIVNTPAFIFCGTKASVKGLTPRALKSAKTQIILSNTYHLMLQPGSALIHKMGGLHTFMGWDGPMFTDSGGFQIFSLGHGSVASEIKRSQTSERPKTLLKIEEGGATFRSYIDGAKRQLTPESAITIQQELGADLIVVLDECTPFNIEKKYTAESMERSHRWGLRSLIQFANNRQHYAPQALYGIIQGGIYPDLRKQSTDFVNSQPFFSHAIGGSLGATKEQMYEVVHFTAEQLDNKRPIHLLGIGSLRDIFNTVPYGIDTFDCVHPTRIARHGGAIVPYGIRAECGNTTREHINLWNRSFALDKKPIDENCSCATCQVFSRAYLHHLLKAGEILVASAITEHNVHVMNQVMQEIRNALIFNTFQQVKTYWLG